MGDIIDPWTMSRGAHRTDAQNAVIHPILAIARNGVEVTRIPGNHDDDQQGVGVDQQHVEGGWDSISEPLLGRVVITRLR